MPPERQLWLTLLLALLALAAAPAGAQETLGEPQASDAFSWPGRGANLVSASPAALSRDAGSYAVPSAGQASGLAARDFLRGPEAGRPAALLRLTRLAGMFMGRVSPWSVGKMRICIKLDVL